MRLMLVDGNSLTYRAFYALPTDLSTASGQVTNAVYGFTSMLLNLVRDHHPDVIAVAFDRPEPTFRHEIAEEYKAQREAAPDILRQQIGLVREVVETLGIPILEQPGYEADDVIATLATNARDEGDEVLVVTGDRDAYQLVEDPLVRVLYNKRGVSEYALYDEAGVVERTGVKPSDYVAYAALRGDPSDNLRGVPGVGEKTAAKLINTYGSIDGIYEHLEDLSPKLRQNLAEHEQQVRQNLEVMELVRDMDLEVGLGDLAPPEPDPEKVRKLFDFLEFHSLYERLGDAFGDLGAEVPPSAAIEAEVIRAESAGDAASRLMALSEKSGGPVAVSVCWEGEPARSRLVGMALVDDPDSGTALWIEAGDLESDPVREGLSALFSGGGRRTAAHDAKPIFRWLIGQGTDPGTPALDSLIAAYLLDPGEGRYDLRDLVKRYLHSDLGTISESESGRLPLDGEGIDPASAAATKALAVGRLVQPLTEALAQNGLEELNTSVELPLIRVLAKMEHVGVGIDLNELRALNDRLASESEELTRQIWEDAGEEFNVNSTPQLRRVLFERLGLTPQKKTKTGYSTDAASLERLVGDHPIIEHLLRYREVEKLRSTYAEGLLAEVADDGRIHATFNQTVARTGRLSSDRPNLHNIPVRTEEGREFRRCFVPADGYLFLVADYNQIELRCIAHLAGDPGLIAAFEAGTDVHTEVASRAFGVPASEVGPAERARAKMVSYGLAYGMEAYGLAQRLNIPTDEAQEILDAYFAAFPAVKDYMERTVAEARSRGYTETLFGRRRHIPELSSSNYRIRQAGERQAMNAGIQGLAADIFKVALVRLDTALDRAGSRSRLILQVHDEVLLEVTPEESEAVSELTLDSMKGAFELSVPLEVELSIGTTWADAKP